MKDRKTDADASDEGRTGEATASDRERRLAAAMRENLKRRKSQARARNDDREAE